MQYPAPMPLPPIQNWLTIDVEDYFQVHALSGKIRPEDWDGCELRVEKNTHRLLDLLDNSAGPRPADHGQQPEGLLQQPASSTQHPACPTATFFVLGWIAERCPNLVKAIHARGHEIASHGYSHQVITAQNEARFREDVRRSKGILEDLIGNAVLGYRAPTFSITRATLWALYVLAEEGYRYDSSVFPIRHDYYGMPSAPRFPFIWNLGDGTRPRIEERPGPLHQADLSHHQMLEFPMSTIMAFHVRFPCPGGGYFRIYPYSLTRWLLRRINREGKPFMFYVHPWEIDPRIPVIDHLPRLARFRTYVNLSKTASRLRQLLTEFSFVSIGSSQSR